MKLFAENGEAVEEFLEGTYDPYADKVHLTLTGALLKALAGGAFRITEVRAMDSLGYPRYGKDGATDSAPFALEPVHTNKRGISLMISRLEEVPEEAPAEPGKPEDAAMAGQGEGAGNVETQH